VVFNTTFRYIDDVLSINNNQIHSYVDSIYPCELEIKDTTEHRCCRKANNSTDKRDDFNFVIVNFPYTCSNILYYHLHNGVYISQLIRYARACSTYDQFLGRGKLLTDKLMLQGFLQSRVMSALCKCYDRYNDLIHNYKLSLSHMLSGIFQTNS
jgi:hypothetical protein